MELSAQNIADYLKGEIVGNPDIKVKSVARIEQGKADDTTDSTATQGTE